MTPQEDRAVHPARAVELATFRRDFYGSLRRWGDALFELCDAALCASGPVGSVPALSLEPGFRRSHGSLYKALARGSIDATRLGRLLVEHRPKDWPLIFAVDGSTWDRCAAETSPERGFYFSASKHSSGQPIVAGWLYQWISQLNWAKDSWTAPLDARRITPHEDTTTATVDQVQHLVGLLPSDDEVPMFVFDAGYDPIAISHGLVATRAQVLVRIRGDRIFYPDPPAPTADTVGRPRRHGARFALTDEATWTATDGELVTHDASYGTVTVKAWYGLHPRIHRHQGRRWGAEGMAPIVRGSVIRVEVEHLPRPKAHIKKTLWLWWSGPGTPDLDLCWRAYLRRFDIEHTYRFVKQTLGWTSPSLQTPEQADRWTWLVMAAYTQLRLARGHVDDLRLPWERPRDPVQLTPARVRRGFCRLRAILGTPASPPKSNTPGPGRPKGSRRPPRTRYPVVKRVT
jgi:hypothetical protein